MMAISWAFVSCCTIQEQKWHCIQIELAIVILFFIFFIFFINFVIQSLIIKRMYVFGDDTVDILMRESVNCGEPCPTSLSSFTASTAVPISCKCIILLINCNDGLYVVSRTQWERVVVELLNVNKCFFKHLVWVH